MPQQLSPGGANGVSPRTPRVSPGEADGVSPRSVTRAPRGSVPWETIPEMVLSTADRFGDLEAIVDGESRLTFSELVGTG